MAPSYEINDLVWAKMKGFSPWPGKIIEPEPTVKKPSKKHCFFVYFFGSDDYAWIETANLKPFFQFRDRLEKANKTTPFKDAIKAIDAFIKEKNIEEVDRVQDDTDKASNKDDEDDMKSVKSFKSDSSFTITPSKIKKKKVPKEGKESKDPSSKETPAKEKKETPGKEKKETTANSKETPTAKEPNAKTPTKDGSSTKKRKNEAVGGEAKKAKKMKKDKKEALLNTMNAKARVSALLDRPVHMQRPNTPTLDVSSVSQQLKDKRIEPSKLKFGFLGLGIMGSGIVKNLINSGHSVLIWNRSAEKCGDFVAVGAKEAMTPSDVVAGADITFSCVSDPQVAKNMVFGNCGVLQEMRMDKGYVEMTSIDSETSRDLSEAISNAGGRYLEAQIQGSRGEAEAGTLVILAAGDRSLFDDCQSSFHAMGKNSFFLGDVGNASKMNLVLSVMTGVTLAGLAESMALADRAGLQQTDVLEVLGLTSVACPLVLDKTKAIIEGGFTTNQALQHMQKDLRLGLAMGDGLELSLPLTAITNELYKHAKRLGYGDHDVSSVYIRTRY